MKKHPKRRRKSSPLSGQKPSKGRIPSPAGDFLKQDKVRSVSWFIDHLPDYLWLAILLTPERRDISINLFPTVLESIARKPEGSGYIPFSMQGLAEADTKYFDAIVGPITAHTELGSALSSMLILPDLPGSERWLKALPPAPSRDSAIETIIMACAAAAAQDGRTATDIAFLNYVNQLIQGNLVGPGGEAHWRAINKYPSNPEDSPIGSLARAHRNGMATALLAEGAIRSEWVETFYRWGRTETPCAGIGPDRPPPEVIERKFGDLSELIFELEKLSAQCLTEDFKDYGHSDAREVCAGLCLYACSTARFICSISDSSFVGGSILLRTLAEVNILLSHLSSADLEEVRRYRRYGAGRAKLLVSKIDELGEGASSFNFEGFSFVASERHDEIYIDMPIGSFYVPSIREVSIASGSKDVYDKFFDIGSAHAHAEWGAVGSSATQICLNPTHLGHYVMAERDLSLELLSDVEWLISRLRVLMINMRDVANSRPPDDYDR